MSATNTVSIPNDLLRDISQRANHTGLSTQEWVSKVLAERVRLELQTEEFFSRRTAGASTKTLGELLDKAGDNPPDTGDEFED
jgi:hypothetical protein